MYALGDEIVDNIVSEEFIMRIEFENIVLRDMIESDIEDYVRWFTVEREWENWDAPWGKEDTDEESERRSWGSYYESVKQLPDDVLRWKLEIEWNGRHIGWAPITLARTTNGLEKSKPVKPLIVLLVLIYANMICGGTGSVQMHCVPL